MPQRNTFHGWFEIGGQRHFYRSAWEVEFAKMLEWLKLHGEVLDWTFEPEVFWFPIRRGVTNYKPDFRTLEKDGRYKYWEIKGWMDPKSKTKIARMKKYHPEIDLTVIGVDEYQALKKQSGYWRNISCTSCPPNRSKPSPETGRTGVSEPLGEISGVRP